MYLFPPHGQHETSAVFGGWRCALASNIWMQVAPVVNCRLTTKFPSVRIVTKTLLCH